MKTLRRSISEISPQNGAFQNGIWKHLLKKELNQTCSSLTALDEPDVSHTAQRQNTNLLCLDTFIQYPAIVKPVLSFATVSLLTGAFALAGSIIGHFAGGKGLFIGATLGGIIGVVAAIRICIWRAWLPTLAMLSATIGGIAGFLLAAYLAATNAHTPVIPILSTFLIGAGALAGAAFKK